MARLVKTVKLLFIIAVFNVIQSCVALFGECNCDDTILYYSANKLDIVNLDNSDSYPIETETNVMHRSAIAFSVSLYDSTNSYTYSALNTSSVNLSGFGFPAANAWSCDCYASYLPNPTVQDFKVYTMLDIDTNVGYGDDVTEYFVGQLQYSSQFELYNPIADVINDQNILPTNSPTIRFNAFLQLPVHTDKAQFMFYFKLSDGRELAANTAIIDIID